MKTPAIRIKPVGDKIAEKIVEINWAKNLTHPIKICMF